MIKTLRVMDESEQHSTPGANAEVVAVYVSAIINQHQKKCDALHDAFVALEVVLQDGLTFSSEQMAEKAVISIKNVMR